MVPEIGHVWKYRLSEDISNTVDVFIEWFYNGELWFRLDDVVHQTNLIDFLKRAYREVSE